MSSDSMKTEERNEKIVYIKRITRLSLSLIISLTLTAVSALIFADGERSSMPDKFFSKSIKTEITTIVKNGGQLDIVKHVYNSRKVEKRGVLDIFKESIDVYEEPTSLSTILNDIKKDCYTSKTQDTILQNNINNIIQEYDEVNPFDKLEANQKFMFENVRQKLDSNYVVVREDMNRIADDVHNRNLLVEQYLDKSNFSYWISIVALVVTVALSTIQIYQNINFSKKFSNHTISQD